MADEPRFRSLREKVAGRNEALGQGLTFGFGDELGAGIQGGLAALTPGMNSGETYRNALSENRGILADEKAAEPGTAAALEAIGSIPTSFVIPGAAGGLGTALKVGGALGAVSGLGHADDGDVGSSVLKGTAGGLAGGAIGHGVGKLAAPIFQKLAQAKLARFANQATDSGMAARSAELARPELQALRGQAEAFGARPAGYGAKMSGKASGYLQQETDKLAAQGTPWADPVSHIPDPSKGFTHGPMSGLRNDDLLWPGTNNVRIPAVTDEESQLFQRLLGAHKAGTPPPSSLTATANLRGGSLEGTPQSVTREAGPGTMFRAFRDALDKEEK